VLLIDPEQKQVYIYRPDEQVRALDRLTTEHERP
jgi:hypothetical protein